jgi:hypothetical protein
MKKFYVFLDVDGVLINYKWKKLVHYLKLNKLGYSQDICPFNVVVLNRLLNKIKKSEYEPVIVVSSSWRYNRLDNLIALLKANNLKHDGKYLVTDKNIVRGKSIKNFIDQNEITDNFVIIDDEISDITPYISSEFIIKASGIFKSGLTNKDIKIFITKRFKDENIYEKLI